MENLKPSDFLAVFIYFIMIMSAFAVLFFLIKLYAKAAVSVNKKKKFYKTAARILPPLVKPVTVPVSKDNKISAEQMNFSGVSNDDTDLSRRNACSADVDLLCRSTKKCSPLQNKGILSRGSLKLYDVDERTAAMIMAIVSDQSGIPLSELCFKSIKAVSE